MTHILKVWPGEYDAVAQKRKTHEVRRNDREFAVGDLLVLKEFIPAGEDLTKGEGRFTGRAVLRRITYITPSRSWGLPPDVCVLSIR
jgi:hypothetical protein